MLKKTYNNIRMLKKGEVSLMENNIMAIVMAAGKGTRM